MKMELMVLMKNGGSDEDITLQLYWKKSMANGEHPQIVHFLFVFNCFLYRVSTLVHPIDCVFTSHH